ncbi:protein FAM166B-like isoform X2 [Photinus pyralis]|uniref:Ciliary microtubule inner protein 2A-C-like domain-containing protein n=1 Tax=Photinus pyralis TaxID=7054 RepID=A0A1Y1LKX4_PHOPY|nr:protein FAM166B-like isoform X2 [Photinus pyralis]
MQPTGEISINGMSYKAIWKNEKKQPNEREDRLLEWYGEQLSNPVEEWEGNRYTGHCPTLRFQYGKPYGTETKEILHDLRDKEIFNEVQRHRYREDDARKIALVPISRAKDQAKDYALDPLNRSPKYILGYTGFIPTLNFRYGKSFGRTADDSMADFTDSQSRLREKRAEMQSLFRTQSAPRMVSIRNRDEVTRSLTNYETLGKFNGREISPDHPPIAGYTGHIPRVKGTEASLSKRYNTVVKRGLALLREERLKKEELLKTSYKINEIISEGKPRYTYV